MTQTEFDDFIPPRIAQGVKYVMEYADFGGDPDEVELVLDEVVGYCGQQTVDEVGEERVRRYVETQVAGRSRR